MSNAKTNILDWGKIYQDSLTTEILRSERRRVTILGGLFAFAACIYSIFSFVPGLLDSAQRGRLQDHWPWMISLYGFVIGYEWALHRGMGWLIEHRRQPHVVFRFLNAFLETSIPTVMLFMAVSFMGPRDALGSPAFLLYFFFILLSILQLDARLCLFTGLVAATEHFFFAYILVGTLEPESPGEIWRSPIFHFNRSLILLVAGLVASLLAQQIKRQVAASLRTVQERDRAVRIFGQYVSPQIAEKLLQQPVELCGELRNVCVMFLDIRDFSVYAANARPKTVMDYLNTLFDFMIDVVNEHQGIVNKFLGDGFMAVFGAPIEDAQRCVHAVGAALEILTRLDRLNAAGHIHPTRVGIGLHMGEAVTGNVGSADRKEYAIIGDVVNLASRLEQTTKEFKARLLISEEVHRNLDGAIPGIEDLGAVALKGQLNPARIFKVA
ncbi:MAG: adenylate/guanylate cyclase domain-containing protein [Chloroflexota bacterium]